ncbi:MAG: glycosyltransferase family 39 protein [Chloroflexota bacterium]|nr:glycosyltransferase family 39 protein [Chloroflexota bacterium]
MGFFIIALAARVVAAAQVDFPPTEVSAYYTGVARNLVEGRGLVTDAVVWYATPPLVVPKPAFELWLPLPTFLAAIPMALLGASFFSAQLSTVAFGALAAPLAWAIALDAARRQRLPVDRAVTVAAGSALVVAVLGPLLVADVAPESTTAFTVLGVLACWLMPRALGPNSPGVCEARHVRLLARAALGIVLGLAYLARQEALFLAAAYVLLLFVSIGRRPRAAGLAGTGSASRTRAAVAALLPTLLLAAVAIAPWLIRNTLVFGTALPGHAIDHAWLTRNEEIFAYAHPPSLQRFLAQGAATIVANQLEALGRNLLTVLLVPAMPVAALGLLAVAALRRSPAVASRSALGVILATGLAIYLFTSICFPIASAWGIYRHSAGPFVVGLAVVSMLGLDALVAAVRRLRAWPRSNAWLAPAGALALVLPFAVLQVAIVSGQARELKARFEDVRLALESHLPELRATRGAAFTSGTTSAAAWDVREPIVSDHPIWLAETLRAPVLALPDEPAADVWKLARAFGARLLVVLDRRGPYLDALLHGRSRACFHGTSASSSGVRIIEVRPQCAGAGP